LRDSLLQRYVIIMSDVLRLRQAVSHVTMMRKLHSDEEWQHVDQHHLLLLLPKAGWAKNSQKY